MQKFFVEIKIPNGSIFFPSFESLKLEVMAINPDEAYCRAVAYYASRGKENQNVIVI